MTDPTIKPKGKINRKTMLYVAGGVLLLALIVLMKRKGTSTAEEPKLSEITAPLPAGGEGLGGGTSGGGTTTPAPPPEAAAPGPPGPPGEPGPAGLPAAPETAAAAAAPEAQAAQVKEAAKAKANPYTKVNPTNGEHYRSFTNSKGQTIHEYHSGRKVTLNNRKTAPKPHKHAPKHHPVVHSKQRAAPAHHAAPVHHAAPHPKPKHRRR